MASQLDLADPTNQLFSEKFTNLFSLQLSKRQSFEKNNFGTLYSLDEKEIPSHVEEDANLINDPVCQVWIYYAPQNTFLFGIFDDVREEIWNNFHLSTFELEKFSIDFPSGVKSELKQFRSEILF